MDFVIELLELLKYNVVMTMIYLVSKKAHFILTHTTITAEDTVRLFLHNMWKLYSLLNYVILNRSSQFVKLFTRKLYWLLEIKIASSMG